jgi:SAM-dependent methyltransferase
MNEYLNRDCPLCSKNTASIAVSSTRRGENLDYSNLRPFWSGFFNEKVFFSYFRCGGCGLLYCPEYFTPEQLNQLYADMAPNMDMVSTGALVSTQRGYWRAVADDIVPGGHYMEIGPDIGYIVKEAAQTNKFAQFWLFEPNTVVHPQLAEAAGNHPVTISADMADFSAVPDGSVSLAVMIHVLDHLLDPVETLQAIRKKLRPDGRLLIVTHNEKSMLRSVMSTRWPPFCLQHPQIYNPDSISRLLKMAGFGSVKVERSVNYFPTDFMLRQAAFAVGMKLDKVPLPKINLGLRLGNIQTIARP